MSASTSNSPEHPTAPGRRVSPAGRALIRAFEGVCLEPQPLDEGRWIIGVSHVVAGPRPDAVDAEAADRLLRADLAPIETAIEAVVLAPLSQSQFDALACLAFNIGVEAFRRSAVVARLNEGRPLEAADGFEAWRFGDVDGRVGVLDAVARRRAAEKALFLRPDAPVAAASSARLRPRLGPEARGVADHAPVGAGGAVALGHPPPIDGPRLDPVLDAPGAPCPDDPLPGSARAERPRALIAAERAAALSEPPPALALQARAQAARVRETTRWCWVAAGVGAVVALGGVYEVAAGGPGAWPAVTVLGVLTAVGGLYFALRPQALWAGALDGPSAAAPSGGDGRAW